MRKVRAGLLSLALTAGLATAFAPAASAAPPETPAGATNPEPAAVDELPNPLAEKQRELREAGLQMVLNGEAVPEQRGTSTVVKVGEEAAPGSTEPVDQYVELGRERTDKIFVVLAEFGDERHPNYPDQDTNPNIPGPTDFTGPRHNEIPEPDRSVDNSTIWQPDYSQEHYENLYFGTGPGVESLKTYYETQSSGRYSVEGMVTDWVRVQYNEARYGRSDGYPCASNVCSNTWFLLRDALNVWVADQYAQGKTDADIAAELASYDVWDRYDYDSDGNFDEPDGYIDHFQIVHAGGDQSDGDPYQGEDAIWAHRWRAFQGTGEGPPNFPIGGTQIGNTGLWVADYTIQPENGGLSVFAHEYGHDLGLPDLYDRTGIGGDGAVGWWSIMAQSRLSDDEDQGIGTRAGDLGPWEKLQLGWFDYEIVLAGEQRTMELGPHEYNTDKPQGVVVVLPQKEVVTELGAPYEGENQYWSGSGDDIDHTMTREVTLPAGPATLEFQARWNIEDCGPDPCDYAYVEVDNGSGWTAIPGSITNPAEGNGIDGYQAEWVPATFDLSAYAGQTIQLRVRYFTDGAVQGQEPDVPSGIFVDNIVLTAGGQVLLEDGAETGGEGWTLDGFTVIGAQQSTFYDNYYIASNREYIAYDRYLQTGPYNFGWPNTRPDWVEHFPYQDGLLIWYWDTSYSDNDVGNHPGHGEILPIDAHPRPIWRLDGQPWRGRIALYDATFGLQRADSFTLHFNDRPSYIRGQDAVPVFDDRRSYWDERTPYTGVIVPNAGVRIRVLEEIGTSVRIRITSTAEEG